MLDKDNVLKPNPPQNAHGSDKRQIFIGCAGWSIPRSEKPYFPQTGTHLERYAAHLPAVEINSSFYRPHRTTTYARWAAAVPEGFRFAVKVPKTITHAARLENADELLAGFLDEVTGLQTKLGCLLVQLPPSLAFESKIARRFFKELRAMTQVPIALEPRHATWFDTRADTVLQDNHIARVAADPPPIPAARVPGGWPGLVYHRLHGSPRTYYSAYSDSFIRELSGSITRDLSEQKSTWCIFDNTALGAAMPNARELLRESQHGQLHQPPASYRRGR